MIEVIARGIKEHCPNAYVINYTNPMTLCVKTLYRVFPEIKAFGCCHEVFGTQKFLARMVEETFGEKTYTEVTSKLTHLVSTTLHGLLKHSTKI